MKKIKAPEQPKMFYCEKCKVYFLSTSQMEKPTHPKCFGHKTRLATKEEIDEINRVNKTSFIYNEPLKEVQK